MAKKCLVIKTNKIKIRINIFSQVINIKAFRKISKNKNTLKMGIGEYLTYKLASLIGRKLSVKEQLLERALNRYSNEVSIINILKRLQELEKLKLIVLSPEQRTLFSFIQKPSICINENDLGDTDEELKYSGGSPYNIDPEILNGENDRSQSTRIFHIYEKFKKNKVLSELDKRLLYYIEKTINNTSKL